MIIVGLTGSIATGKSTIASFFKQNGCPLYDADYQVHALYQNEAVSTMQDLIPEAIVNGQVDRNIIKKLIQNQPELLPKIEAIIHPMLYKKEQEFLQQSYKNGHKVVVLDIPLLLEKGREQSVDCVCVTSCKSDTQRLRLKQRSNISEVIIETILTRQMPINLKKLKAHILIDTDQTLEYCSFQVKTILKALYHMNKGNIG